VDAAVVVPSDSTARIQESHIAIAHVICELVEASLFPADDA
jgi:D-sedoheptulose 7-phosphate isomerase